MSCYTRILSWLGSKEAYKIDMECKKKEREYKDEISKLLEEKRYLLSIIAQNVNDIAGIKTELTKVNEKLAEVLAQNKSYDRKITLLEMEGKDFAFIIEKFLEKYPEARLSEMVKKKNENN